MLVAKLGWLLEDLDFLEKGRQGREWPGIRRSQEAFCRRNGPIQRSTAGGKGWCNHRSEGPVMYSTIFRVLVWYVLRYGVCLEKGNRWPTEPKTQLKPISLRCLTVQPSASCTRSSVRSTGYRTLSTPYIVFGIFFFPWFRMEHSVQHCTERTEEEEIRNRIEAKSVTPEPPPKSAGHDWKWTRRVRPPPHEAMMANKPQREI